jgi:hypothetical protein
MELYEAGVSTNWAYVPIPGARNVCRASTPDYLEKKLGLQTHIKTPFYHLGYTYLFTPKGAFARRSVASRPTLERMWTLADTLYKSSMSMRQSDTSARISRLFYDLGKTKWVFPTDPEVFACVSDDKIDAIVNNWPRLKNPPAGIIEALEEIRGLRDEIEFVE